MTITRSRLWKTVGVAGLLGVATTGIVLARDQRRRRAYTAEEIRSSLHARLDAAPAHDSAPSRGELPDPDSTETPVSAPYTGEK